MIYRRFGKTEKNISVVTLGGMRFPKGWREPRDTLPRESIQSATDSLQRAVAAGINHFETAYGYVKSEHLYGHALRELKLPRDSYYLMTKGSPMTAEETRTLVDQQLKALGLDRIDFYGWHGINNRERYEVATAPGGPVEELLKMAGEGIIGNVGFSTHAPLDVILDAIHSDLFSFVNLHYYYFFQKNFPAVEAANNKDIGIFIISPNDKGGRLWEPSEKLAGLTAPLEPVVFNALFCLSNPAITTLSYGMHRPEHFTQNLKFLESDWRSVNYLNAKRQLDIAGQSITHLCTVCDKCLPCPADINIPEVLRFRNLVEGYDMTGFGKYRYNMFEEKGHWFPGRFANVCTHFEPGGCSDCLPRCPVNLPIPELLRETHGKLFSEKK